MSSNFPVYRHHGNFTLAALTLILISLVVFVFVFMTEAAFQGIGFTPLQVIVILAVTLLGSAINIPLLHISSWEDIVTVKEVQFFWITYRIPTVAPEQITTLVAVNLGGAIIPVFVSVYLLGQHISLLPQSLGALVTSIIVHLVARKVPGVGIATPAFIPPIGGALTAYLIAPNPPL